MYFNIDLKNNTYLISEKNFGMIRYGDLVAISTISKALKIQFPKAKFIIKISNNIYDLIDVFSKNFDGYFVNNIKINYKIYDLPFSCNCWSLYTYLYKNFYLIPDSNIYHILNNPIIVNNFNIIKSNIDYFKRKYNSKVILFIPLFSTPNNNYNHDRFFPIDFCIDLINNILSLYNNYFILLVGHEKNYFFKKLKSKIIIKPKNLELITVKNIMETIYLMTISDIYIGGDTGTSHIISVLKNTSKKLIFLYGKNSKNRHFDMDKVAKKLAKIKKYIYNDYSPKPLKEKTVYYYDNGFTRETINFVMESINAK